MDDGLNHRKRRFVIRLLAVLLVWPSLVHGNRIELPSVAAYEVSIANSGNRTIIFELRPEGGTWRTYSIRSGRAEDYHCEECGRFEFSMRTEGRDAVRYYLDVGRRYIIIWNDAKEMWDLRERTSS